MTLKLKTNRNDIIAWWLPLFIVIVICYVWMAIDILCFKNDRNIPTTGEVVFYAIFGSIYLIAMLVVKFWDRKKYLFTNENIQVLKRNKQINLLFVENIVRIKYIKCNIRYLWKRVSGDSMSEGYACKMYVELKQGDLITLGCFSMRDAKKIKKLYGDIVQFV